MTEKSQQLSEKQEPMQEIEELDEASLDQIAGGTKISEMMQMLSNIMQAQHEIQKSIISNVRA